ncbi:CENP-B N-terminal DNA-binding domain [Popillia japonica]|uniref:CENP-B N-terminal DNA-binding domain n=1 Tax=Popillia japonica TaxID=7064 RepID=A0AAW1LTA5_POPJA
MVRNYKRKRIEPAPSENNYANAIQAVAGGMGLRKAAAVYGVKHNTLFYRIKTTESKVAAEERGETVANRLEYSSIYSTSQVFTTTEEELLVKSGWMTKELFMKVLLHIKLHTNCSPGSPILIIMDNHETYCSLEAILYAKENGMVLLTFPPHTSHRLQPLDVTVYSPFKSRYAVALNDWIISNPGKAATIRDLAMIVNVAYQSTFTIKNIIEWFRKTGIWPLNKLIFSDNDYDCAFVTDQSEVTELQTEKRTPPDNIENQTPNIRLATMSNETPSTSKGMLLDTPTNSPSVNCIAPPHVTPEDIRPLPKAPIRKQSVLKRKTIRSRLLTESPEKNKIEEETVNRERKKKLVEERKLRKDLLLLNKRLNRERKKKLVEERKLRKDLLLLNKRLKAKTDYEGSSEESEIEMVYAESDGSLSFCEESTSEDDTSSGTEFLIGDYVS